MLFLRICKSVSIISVGSLYLVALTRTPNSIPLNASSILENAFISTTRSSSVRSLKNSL
jgi:hypothetical protein